MKKYIVYLLTVCLLVSVFAFPALAENVPDSVISQALMRNVHPSDEAEFWAEGHTVLGTQTEGNKTLVYLYASTSGYGFSDGKFVPVVYWNSGFCTMVLRCLDGCWTMEELRTIENSSELPGLMPKEYSDKLDEDLFEGVIAQKTAKAQAYLASIGRSETVRKDNTGVMPETTYILSGASNVLNCMDGDYPYYCITIEKLIDGVRYLFARTWQPDENAPVDPIYEGNLYDSGTTGTITLTKTRKEDGRVVESIVVRAELYEITLTMKDNYGTKKYVFPYAGYIYKPTVTQQGKCRVDTYLLDQFVMEMEGEGTNENTTEAQAQVGTGERFTILRSGGIVTLVNERLQNGQWVEIWRNDKLFFHQMSPLNMQYYPEGYTFESERITQTIKNAVVITSEDHNLAIVLTRVENDWQVAAFIMESSYTHAYMYENCMLLRRGFSSSMQDHVFYIDWEWHAATTRWDDFGNQYYYQDKMIDTYICPKDFAGTTPIFVSRGINYNLPVYTSPSDQSPRAANGKAAVSLNDWMYVLCRENDWLLVLYETSSGHYRVGWIQAEKDELWTLSQDAVYDNTVAKAVKQTDLFDDPVNGTGKLCTLPEGQQVTILSDGFCGSYYVEATVNGKTWRGFVLQSTVQK